MVLFDTIEMVMQNEHPEYELIVVDQTQEINDAYQQRLDELRQQYDFRYIRLPEPNLTFARNVGLKEASGDVIIFIDDDVELEPDFISNHVKCYADPAVGAVAGRVIESKGDTTHPSKLIGCLREDGSIIGNFHLSDRREVDYGRGCNMSFRRDHLIDIGLCDERYSGGFYREDSDLFARVKRLGKKVVFEPTTRVVHLESDGGSRTVRGRKDLKRQYSVFKNETLFFMSCMDEGDFFPFAHRMLRWTYAVAKRKGCNWLEFLYLWSAFFDGIRVYYFVDPRHLSKNYGFYI